MGSERILNDRLNQFRDGISGDFGGGGGGAAQAAPTPPVDEELIIQSTYVGDGTAAQAIVPPGAAGVLRGLKIIGAQAVPFEEYWKLKTMAGDTFNNDGALGNFLTGGLTFSGLGFTVDDTGGVINNVGVTYHYIAFYTPT